MPKKENIALSVPAEKTTLIAKAASLRGVPSTFILEEALDASAETTGDGK